MKIYKYCDISISLCTVDVKGKRTQFIDTQSNLLALIKTAGNSRADYDDDDFTSWEQRDACGQPGSVDGAAPHTAYRQNETAGHGHMQDLRGSTHDTSSSSHMPDTTHDKQQLAARS